MHVKHVTSAFLAKNKILQLKKLRKYIIVIIDIVLYVSKINFNREKNYICIENVDKSYYVYV